jgi:hypothetical protein
MLQSTGSSTTIDILLPIVQILLPLYRAATINFSKGKTVFLKDQFMKKLLFLFAVLLSSVGFIKALKSTIANIKGINSSSINPALR